MISFFPSTLQNNLFISGLLDGYEADCVFAFSTRLLFSSYSGPCMRVSLDQISFTDINFNSNGIVDEASILSFGGINDVYFEFYDQSGNGFNTFKGSLDLPKISIGGTIQKIGAIPSGYWNLSSFSNTTTKHTETNFLYKISTTRTGGTIYISASGVRYGLVSQQGSTSTTWRSQYGTPSVYKNKSLQAIVNRNDVYNAIIGDPVIIEKSANTNGWPDFSWGRQVGGSFILDGKMNDFVQYSGSQPLSRLEEISDLISTGY